MILGLSSLLTVLLYQVPPEVEPLFKQIVNQFVHDRSRPEAISVRTREKEKAEPFWRAVPGEESIEMITTMY
ncbi:hypothetical protein Peur_055863 [Populus x canadensis]